MAHAAEGLSACGVLAHCGHKEVYEQRHSEMYKVRKCEWCAERYQVMIKCCVVQGVGSYVGDPDTCIREILNQLTEPDAWSNYVKEEEFRLRIPPTYRMLN